MPSSIKVRKGLTLPGYVLPPADSDQGVDVRLYLSPKALALLIVVLTLVGRLIEAILTICYNLV
jgi:hypothetical protein